MITSHHPVPKAQGRPRVSIVANILIMSALPRQILFTASLLVAALICVAVAPFMRQASGSLGPIAMTADSPVLAVTTIILALACATALGILVGRAYNASMGLFVVGFGLAVLSLNLAPLQEIAFHGKLGPVVISLAVWTGLVLLVSVIVFRCSGPIPEIKPLAGEPLPDPFKSNQALQSCACGLIVLPIVWLVAKIPVDGQTLAAVTIGATLAGLVGRLVAPSVQPVLLFAAPCAAGFLGALWGWLEAGPTSQLSNAFVMQDLLPLSYPMPLDYVAGSLMGVSIGIGWSKSFLQEEQPPSR